MMYLLLTSTLALMTPWIMPLKLMWTTSMMKSLMISTLSLKLLNHHYSSFWHKLSWKFATDPLSAPLIILSCWLVPMSLLASMKTMKNQKMANQRIFISLIFTILIALMLTFSSLELSLFYMAFETTLLPTLTLMARWGAQKERYQASMYFLFYTLAGSLPLLMGIISIYTKTKTITIPSMFLMNEIPLFSSPLTSVWWMFCLIAFMVKMPIYGLHLWLPKAHVEAPMAGSMILAAILLKLGGYGLTRTIMIFYIPSSNTLSFPLMTMCIWGALMTSMICLRQTDLKALMAYSSVGHMSMVASGMFTMSLWGMKGALTLMMAHGLVSSALFCLANLLYERKSTRTLAMTRGFKLITPLLTIWWMISCVSNLGLPPTPKLMGELFILSAIMDWKTLSTPIVTMATVFGAIYSLLMLKKTKKKNFPNFMSKIKPITSCEHMLMSLHLLPLMLLIISPTLILLK